MKKAQERKRRRRRRSSSFSSASFACVEQEKKEALEMIKSENIKRNELAVKLQCLARMKIARGKVKLQRVKNEVAIKIQTAARSKLARGRMHQRKIEAKRVVPKGYPLRVMLKRSKVIRERGGWRELVDKMTENVFYYCPKTYETQWEVPEAFLGTTDDERSSAFACTWGECAATFDTLDELTAHRNKHLWMCPACFSPNGCDDFPQCASCPNKLDADGYEMGRLHGEILPLYMLKDELRRRDLSYLRAREELIVSLNIAIEEEMRAQQKQRGRNPMFERLHGVPVPGPRWPPFSAKDILKEKRKEARKEIQVETKVKGSSCTRGGRSQSRSRHVGR